ISPRYNDGRIVGGTDAKSDQAPFQVSIVSNGWFELQHICGGALAGRRSVVTAAHCCGDSYTDLDNNSHEFRPQRQLRLILGYNSWQWLFLILATIEVSAITTFTVFEMDFQQMKNQSMDTSFIINLIVLVINGFSLLFLFHGVFWDKQHDISLFLVTMSLNTVYIAIEFAFTSDYNSAHKLTRLSIAVCFTSVMIILSRFVIYFSREYSIIGVAPALINMYKNQCCFQILLKLDFLNSVRFLFY
ncbi:unnamed protein product, partial [Medioppia subpectinata]